MTLPWYDGLFSPVLQAMKRLGSSASIVEINDEVIKSLDLSNAELAQMHDDRQTEIAYRLAWARTYLKIYGLLNNSGRGVWVLTPAGRDTDSIDPLDVNRVVRQRTRKSTKKSIEGVARKPSEETGITIPAGIEENDIAEAEQILEESWRDELLGILRAMEPNAFERLCQLLLRESGFDKVRVTGKSGDGGIDGIGIVRLGGLLGFPVIFQCKRYQGSVSSSTVRDFRGAMVGRADRGLIITTGTFTRDAQAEAVRDGAPPIDLVDADQLLDKLKELKMGVEVAMIERVSIQSDWFRSI